MKIKYKRLLLKGMKHSIYGLIFQILLMASLVANESNAQSVKEYKVFLALDNASVTEVFELIESRSDFNFNFKDEDINKRVRITLVPGEYTVAEVLELISKEASLKFKQINENISASRIVRADRKDTEFKAVEDYKVITITGKVTDEDNLGMPQATIQLKGTTNGVLSNIDGTYRITIPDNGGTLVFSFTGYTSQEVIVGNQTIINIQLKPDVTSLGEVVVTGYGVERKREITGSIASIKGDEIQNLPLQSFDRALQGRAAGVLVQNANGVPGGALRVRIRGQGSINAGNDPLYIIDGVQINNTNNASNLSTNPLASLNPNDIESMEILKDAAASIYGSQAANGVVLITTKRGAKGKTKINFNTYSGWVTPINLPDMMNSQEFINFRLDQRRNFYTRFPTANPDLLEGLSRRNALAGLGPADWAPLGLGNVDLGQIPQGEFDAFVNGLETFDWLGETFSETGRISNYELSARGGSDNTRFFISGSYNAQEGQIRRFDFERATLRFNIDHDLNENITFETKFNSSTIRQNGSILSGAFFENPAFAGATILPFNPIFDDSESTGFNEPLAGILAENPIKSLSINERTTRTNQINASAALNFKITDNLRFRSFAGIDYRALEESRYTDPRSFGGRNTSGSAFGQFQSNVNFITTQQLNYDWAPNRDNKFNFLLAAEYREEVNEAINVNAQNFPTPQFRTIQSAAEPTGAGGFFTTWKNAGVFTNIRYALKDKFFLNGTLRYDGSSRFGVDNRWGLFPSLGASWLLSEETFMKTSWLDEFKLRASYGTAGNNRIGNFASRGLVSSAGAGNYLNLPGLTISGLANRQLSWETQTTINFGVDYILFGGRISGSIDAYRRRSTDLLLNRSLPQTSGYGSISENVGELDNTGLEFAIRSTNIDAGDFRWTSSFNIAFQDQELLSLFDGEENNGAATQVGQPLNLWYNFQYAGVNPATGRPLYFDRNGNLTYQPTAGSTIGDENDDRAILGNTNSDFFGGLSNTFTYKGFTLDVLFQFDYGKQGLDGTGNFAYTPYESRLNLYSQLQDLVWRQPGDIVSFPRPNIGAELGGRTIGTPRRLQDLSYIRLKQVTVSYDLPTKWLNSMKLSSARVYVQGINLATWTNFTGLDPEFVGGTATGVFPPSKNITVGLQLGL